MLCVCYSVCCVVAVGAEDSFFLEPVRLSPCAVRVHCCFLFSASPAFNLKSILCGGTLRIIKGYEVKVHKVVGKYF